MMLLPPELVISASVRPEESTRWRLIVIASAIVWSVIWSPLCPRAAAASG